MKNTDKRCCFGSGSFGNGNIEKAGVFCVAGF
jgi:hypothetical protein